MSRVFPRTLSSFVTWRYSAEKRHRPVTTAVLVFPYSQYGSPLAWTCAAVDWCAMNQVVDMNMLFEDPEDVDMLLGHFLDTLPLTAGGVYEKRLCRRLDAMRWPM